MFGGTMSFRQYRGYRKLYNRSQKVIKGKAERSESINVILHYMMSDILNLELNLYQEKDIIDRAHRNLDANQREVDKIYSEVLAGKDTYKDINDMMLSLDAEKFSNDMFIFQANSDDYKKRYLTYLVNHYMRVTYGGSQYKEGPDMTMFMPFGDFWKDIETWPEYDDIWEEVVEEQREILAYQGIEMDNRIFKPTKAQLSSYFYFLELLHKREDTSDKRIFNSCGEIVENGDIVNVAVRVFGKEAVKKHGLPGYDYSSAAYPHLDFHGMIEEVPPRDCDCVSSDEMNQFLTWEPDYICDMEFAMKNGDTLDWSSRDKLRPEEVAYAGKTATEYLKSKGYAITWES